MTLEEINSLVLEDVKRQIQWRVEAKAESFPEVPVDQGEDFDYDAWYDEQFTQADLDAELVLYKAELVVIETERLRKKDLKDRFENLSDMRLAFHTLHPDTPNPAVFLRDLLEQDDHADAEAKIAAIEAKDVELLPDPVKEQFKQDIKVRNDDLLGEGITRDIMIEAIVRKEFLNDPVLFNTIKPKIEQVDQRNPNAKVK